MQESELKLIEGDCYEGQFISYVRVLRLIAHIREQAKRYARVWCETCHNTGYSGDNGPGKKGNQEWAPCDACKIGKITAWSESREEKIERLKDELYRAKSLLSEAGVED